MWSLATSSLLLLLGALSTFGSPAPNSVSDVKAKLASLGIEATFPGDPSYAVASQPFNLRFSFKPTAVAFPDSPKEISELVKIGAALNIPVVPRGGGHSYIANGLGGQNGVLVVDLRKLDKVTLDSEKKIAKIESGNRLGDIATALGDAGRALPHGVCPYVGIGGHASFGGFGFSSRMWGLTLDTITAVNTVLANGTIARVTEESDPELFWGLRGSASSFGITTSIEVTTFPAPPSATIFQYDWDLSAADAAKGISAFQSFVQTNIPSHFSGEINLFPGSKAGNVKFSLLGGWYAPVKGLKETLAPFMRSMPKNPKPTINTGTYMDSAIVLSGSNSLDTKSKPDGNDTFYAKSLMTPESSPVSDKAILAFTRYLANEGFATKLEWFVQWELYGGKNSAINAVSVDATAFAHRSSTFTIQFYASAPHKAPPFPNNGFTFMDNVVNTLTSNSPADWDYGAYPNYIEERLPNWQFRYYGQHYERLRLLKDKYDPNDVFDFPTAIED